MPPQGRSQVSTRCFQPVAIPPSRDRRLGCFASPCVELCNLLCFVCGRGSASTNPPQAAFSQVSTRFFQAEGGQPGSRRLGCFASPCVELCQYCFVCGRGSASAGRSSARKVRDSSGQGEEVQSAKQRADLARRLQGVELRLCSVNLSQLGANRGRVSPQLQLAGSGSLGRISCWQFLSTV